jgi:hypothetical protein
MAIYHASAKIIGRSSGRSSVASAAYRSSAKLTDERTGLVYDYTRKRGVVYSEVILPDNAPKWMGDREKLWNAVEAVERRKDAQLAREFEIAIPRELSPDERLALVRSYAREQFVERGMIADVAYHTTTAKDGGEHPHAHIMLTMRSLTSEGFGNKERGWNQTELLEAWRQTWAEHANRALEAKGIDDRIDHRTLMAQQQEALAVGDLEKAVNLDRQPEPKIGPTAYAMEKRGMVTARGDLWRSVRAANDNRRTLRQQIERLGGWLRRIGRGWLGHHDDDNKEQVMTEKAVPAAVHQNIGDQLAQLRMEAKKPEQSGLPKNTIEKLAETRVREILEGAAARRSGEHDDGDLDKGFERDRNREAKDRDFGR